MASTANYNLEVILQAFEEENIYPKCPLRENTCAKINNFSMNTDIRFIFLTVYWHTLEKFLKWKYF